VFLNDEGEVEAIGDFYFRGITGKNFDEFDLPTISTFAPEYFTNGEEPNMKSDIWQVGVLLYEMTTA
jgi:serine/threonine protein kinase